MIPYVPIVKESFELSKVGHIPSLIIQRHDLYIEKDLDSNLWFDYHIEMQNMKEHAEVVPVPSNHELYILYTSGTTGQPKGIVRDTGGTIVALNWALDKIMDVHKGTTFFAASDIGWVVGHSFIIYGPLIRGATTVMFEGKPVGTPDAGTFW